MRYLTVLARPTEGDTFHPLGERLSEEPSVTREAIHHVELLADGTVLLFGEASGSQERYREIMSEAPSVQEYLVSGDDPWMAVSQFEPSPSTRRMLELTTEFDIVIETPIHVQDDGTLRVTHLGRESKLQSLFRAIGEDAPVGLEVVDTGTYEPDHASFARLLTDRQREVLEAAVDVGYYDAPRAATLEDVADAVDIAPTTVGEHLQKVESRVFNELVR